MDTPFTVPPEPWTVVQEASDELLTTLIEEGGFSDGSLTEAQLLLQRLATSGHVTRDPDQRRVLRNKLAYWAAEIRLETRTLVHAPRLLRAGKGSGLALMSPADLLQQAPDQGVSHVEVQGAKLRLPGEHPKTFTISGSFLLRCSMMDIDVMSLLGLAGTSFLGGEIANVNAQSLVATDARFIGLTIRNLRARSADLERVRMPYAAIEGGSLTEAIFDDGNLAGDDRIDPTDASDIDDYGIEKTGSGATRFTNVDLQKASFRAGARLRGVVFENCALQGATFSGSNLAGTVFRDCAFSGDEFSGALDYEYAEVTDSRGSLRLDPRALGESSRI